MEPDDAGLRQALGAGGNDILLAELVQHEGARHAADVGKREIAEQRSGQDDVPEEVPDDGPFPLQDGVDQVEARVRREGIFVDDVHPAGIGDPAELGVEQHQCQQPEPEDRHGIADKPDHPHHLVGDAAALDGGQDAERDA